MTNGTDELARRQNEALGRMMGADSARIDSLVGDVGSIKGSVHEVRSKVEAMDGKVDKLSDALAVMVRHEVQMDHQRQDAATTRQDVEALKGRMGAVENAIGPLQESRTWTVQAFRVVLGLVLVAVVGLVLVKGPVA